MLKTGLKTICFNRWFWRADFIDVSSAKYSSKFQCELMCQFEIGDNLRYYKVNDLCSWLTNDAWIAANVPIRNWWQFKVLQSEWLSSCFTNDAWIAANVPLRNWWQFKVLQSEWLMFMLDKWCLDSSSFFHAFTECDITSSFYNHNKFKFFDAWMKYNEKDDVTNSSKELCNKPLLVTDNHLNISEKFVLSVLLS